MAFLILGACGESPSNISTDTSPLTETVSDDPLEVLNDRIVASPMDIGLYLQRAELFEAEGDHEKAFEDLRRAMAIDSAEVMVHSHLGDLYFETGQVGQAKYAYEQAVRLDEDHVASLLGLAEVYYVLKNHDRAMTKVNEALMADEQVARAYLLKGLIAKAEGNRALARSSFQTASELDSNDPESFNLLGMSYSEDGDSLALAYYRTALEIDSMHLEASYNLAMFHQEYGEPSRALEAYDRLLRLHPETAVAYYNKGYIYLGYLDSLRSAVDAFTEAIRVNPNYVQAYHNRGIALEELGKKDQAIKDFEMALELQPNYPASIEAMNRISGQ